MRDDPFDTLGVRASFDLDPDELRTNWLRRSLDAHPDRAASDEEARELASRLNHARRMLENSESRADALLIRLGGPSREEEKGLPDGFLMEIMELREGLETAQATGDPAALEPHREAAEREREKRLLRVREMFAESESPDDAQRRAIRIELNAWRYLERMLEQVDPAVSAG